MRSRWSNIAVLLVAGAGSLVACVEGLEFNLAASSSSSASSSVGPGTGGGGNGAGGTASSAGGGGNGGNGTGGASSSVGGNGGSGGCTMPSDCPGIETLCIHQTCTNSICGTMFEPNGKDVGGLAVGDCKKKQCNSSHVANTVEDATDPYFDGNECTIDACNGTMPENTPLADETPCPNTMGAYCCTSMFCDQTPTGIACRECHPNVPGSCTNMATPVCQKGKCVPNHCTSTMKDGDEGGPDCGGSCALCADGIACTLPADCESKICTGTPKTCAAPSCSDNNKNGTETGTDCGGSCPTKCTDGLGCVLPTDCESGVCTMNLCAVATCSDGVKNGSETDIDCGGSCSPCP